MSDSSRNPFLEALHAGLSPIPVDTTTKKPLVAWKGFQSERAEDLVCQEWGERGLNIGVVCGTVSGRLIALDFERAFMERGAILLDARVHELLMAWGAGYTESTARGGRHILIRLEGSGPMEGNRKLAFDADGHVLIETRGEGGYVVIAPSRNGSSGWTLLKGGLEQVCYVTQEEWDVVVAGLTATDERPPAPPPPVPTSTGLPPMLRLEESWIDRAKATLPDMESVLEGYGWSKARSHDQYGQHWARPGKDPRGGHSASVNHESGNLFVHSSNAGLPVGVSLDVVDVLWCYTYSAPRRPALDERTEWLRLFADRRAAATPAERLPRAADRDDDPATDSVRLDDSFWQSSELLIRVNQAARSRLLAPSAVLGAYLSAYATTVPMGIWLPAISGRPSPLNLFCCLVGRSGSGKTAAMGAAEELLGWNVNTDPDILMGCSLRSGEGLPRLVVIPEKKGSDIGPTYHHAVQIEFDEGGTLGKQSERTGSTTIPYLNQAWSGRGNVGGAKAGEITQFPAGFVRVCATIGVQYGAAANLFTGEAAKLGFPQRLIYFDLSDPSLNAMPFEQRELNPLPPLGVKFHHWSDYTRARTYMGVPEHVQEEIWLWSREASHGKGLEDPLDGHLMLSRMRVAAIFALMEDRLWITDQDWSLGCQVLDASRQIRSQLVESTKWAERARSDARKMEAIELRDALDNRQVEKIARRVVRQLERSDGLKPRQLRDKCFRGEERALSEEVWMFGELRGWFVRRDGAYWIGDSGPR